jgi:hypothetical protein
MNKWFLKGIKIAKIIILLIFSIFVICFVIHNKSVINKLLLKNKDVNNIILYYEDKEILESALENVQNMSFEERRQAYYSAIIKIYIEEEYWKKIIDAIKKSKYSKRNIEIFFGTRFKMDQPLYNIIIEYKNGKKMDINLWERLFYIDGLWYSGTNEYKEILVIIKGKIETKRKDIE